MKIVKLALASSISLVLAACGGGSSSNLGNSNAPLYIDSTNVIAATATAIKTASGTTFELFNPKNFAADIYEALSPLEAKNIPCTNIGGNIAADLTNITGTMVYSNCIISGKTFNGTVYVYNALLDTNIDRVTATLNFNSLTAVTGSGSTTLTGWYDLTANGLNPNISPSFRATETVINNFPEKLILTNNAGQREVLSNFNFDIDVISTFTATYAGKFTLASDSLGGLITH